jgi:aspartate-semialdehyde dehydrogenase
MSANRKYRVAVVGATGAVGQEMIKVLEQRNFPVQELVPLASERSQGKEVSFNGSSIPVQILTPESFRGVDIALFSAGGTISKEFGPIAAKSGTVVIDNSNAFRMDSDVPLVVPEVNPHTIDQIPGRRIIANPNCSTIQLVVALAPLHKKVPIKRVVVATYQATSGAGKAAMDELSAQTKSCMSNGEISGEVFPHQIAFNCIPHIDVFEDNGFTREEMKVIRETKKIMDDQSIAVTVTAVRVPVFHGHSEAVNLEFATEFTPEDAREILGEASGIEVVDDPANTSYPMAIHAEANDPVYVGRIRKDPSVEHGLNMWVVADNLRKGAALNAVQIAELVICNL